MRRLPAFGLRLPTLFLAMLLGGDLIGVDGAAAQIPTEFTNLQVLPSEISRGDLIGIMREFSFGTGLRCEGCHVAADPLDFGTFDFASDERREKRVARDMLRMVSRVNREIFPAIVDLGPAPLEVGCATCHAGRPRPTTLDAEVVRAHAEGGVEAAEARYGELRSRYYGRGALDFGPRSLDRAAESIAADDPVAALRLVELNLGHHPESITTWNLKGALHVALDQREAAITAYERALELGPNPPAEQALEALRGGG